MKFILLYFLVLTMLGLLSPADVHGFKNDDSNGAGLMKKMIGDWDIEGRIRQGPDSDFRSLNGKSSIRQHYSEGQLREEFELGGRYKGEIFMNFSGAHKRFELFQIDGNSARASALFLVGEVSDSRIKFKGMENYPQWGIGPSLDIRWEYVFLEDGTFRHEIYMKDQKGEYFLQSEYIYRKAEEN
ncbi:MAG: DUF1579 domain-containing protein [Acidobacteria bacterium]|nr:MAG: DUF1579 domain-containing protein [Acidobacteriota bacterium]REJ98076.1 MAG: DUF1579 domain-containing protein [Acidobacteriota bacterium]REK16819.1 MAG: DUF1579 domain-containing protein [Acidobacteriota bacterium]REK42730.1 MAG: DUF1579 domain-containing protein [Acidobacteriota bacterium]